jgi:hypothetical protein
MAYGDPNTSPWAATNDYTVPTGRIAGDPISSHSAPEGFFGGQALGQVGGWTDFADPSGAARYTREYTDYINRLRGEGKTWGGLTPEEKIHASNYYYGTGGGALKDFGDRIGKEVGRIDENWNTAVTKTGLNKALPFMFPTSDKEENLETYKLYEPALMAAGAYMGATALGGLGAAGGGSTAATGGAGLATPAITGGGAAAIPTAAPIFTSAGLGASAGMAGSAGASAAGSGLGLTDYLALGGDLLGMYGDYQAAEAQQDAINQAAAQARAAGAYGTQAYSPYMQAGLGALTGLGQMGQYDPTTDPQYQNQLAEMSRLMDMRSAATGMGRSSADLKQRAALGSDLYGQAYNREYNRLGDLLGLGQYGTTGAVNAQLGQAGTLGNLALQGGQVQGNQLAGLYGGLGQAFQLPAITQQQNLQNQMYTDYIAAMNRGY